MMIGMGWGGAAAVLYDLSKSLAIKGIDVKILINREIIAFFKDLPNIDVINIGPYNKNLRSRNRYINYIFRYINHLRGFFLLNVNRVLYLKNLKKKILKINPDILHIHSYFALELFVFMDFKFNFPVVFTLHGDMRLDKKVFNPKQLRKKRIIKIGFKRVDYITASCNFLFEFFDKANLFVNIDDNKKVLIPIGLDLNRIKKIEAFELNDNFNMIFGGGARTAKGGDILIRALPYILEKIPKCTLYILRDVPKNHFIRNYVLKKNLVNNVKFIGFADYPNYFGLIKAIDMAIVPSRTESIAISILEYMYCGIPIVATKVGGTPEIIRNNENGVLVDPNPESIAKGIIYLYENPDLMKEIVKNGRKESKKYSWDIVLNKYLSFFSDIFKKKSI